MLFIFTSVDLTQTPAEFGFHQCPGVSLCPPRVLVNLSLPYSFTMEVTLSLAGLL